MPLEEPRLVLTRQWLAKATQDLGLAEHAVEDTPFLGGAVFHCQQAAEKALKAFLTWRGQPFRKTHQLVELVQACADLDAAFAAMQELSARHFASAEGQEGMRAFAEKRRPVWSNA